MPADKLEIRIPAAKLLIAMLVVITPLCVFGLIAMTRADQALERTVGNHFRTIAEHAASEVSQFIHNCVTDIGVMAMESSIVAAVTEANSSYEGKSEAALARHVQDLERIWNTPASQATVNQILASPTSRMLRRQRDFDRRFLRITVTDEKGGTVAATHKTLDYYQADEEFWQNIYASGRGAVSVTDILYDDVTKTNYIGIGVPILEETSNRFLGVVDALVDVSSVFSAVGRMQFTPASRMLLIKEDGTVIAGPGVNLAMKVTSDEYAAVQDRLRALAGQQAGYAVPDTSLGRQIIGFADTGLKRDYGKLGWWVLMAQEADEALSPVRMVQRLLGFVSLLGLAAVTLLGVYVYLHRPAAYVDLGGVGEPAAATKQG